MSASSPLAARLTRRFVLRARIYVMAKDLDPEIAGHSLDDYEPASPLSFEAVMAAGLAAIGGWAGTHLVAWPIRRVRRP